MDICDAYYADKNFLGEIGVCFGTKEREACSCQGDKTKCDFYPKTDIRPITTSVAHYTLDLENGTIRAKPIITNADRLRSMTDEELAKFLQKDRGGCRALTTESYVCDFYTDDLQTDCNACWLDWLQQEVGEE